MEDERIDTLVLPIEPKAARPPRLDRNGSVWAAAAKLGRYLMSGMTQEEREGLALPLLRAGEAWYVASMSAFPASHCGTHV